ncbi:MAG: hypothetical protein WCI38_04645 [Chthoniobacterales bacterium]|jgi:hypothetical protein
MAKRPRRRQPQGKRLNTSFAATELGRVPVRWVKFVCGLFLLPLSYILTAAFFSALTQATAHQFYRAPEFLWFSGGVASWLALYFFLPHPLLVYVFGHELTHAVAVYLAGGHVSKFKVRSDGGHIVSNKINTWIALSPYFVPIYSVIVIGVYAGLLLFYDVTPYLHILYLLVGATWAFHATFTVTMIGKGQTDLAYGGTFFSLLVIYLMNLLLLTFMLLLASPQHDGFAQFFHDLMRFVADFCLSAEFTLRALCRSMRI